MLEILKQMNTCSNNHVADQLAKRMGGATAVMQKATAAIISPPELQLINGSGLGQENRLSPRTVTGVFLAIQDHLKSHQLTLADLFPVSGRDFGTIKERNIPALAAVKTGTLWNVSALAGVLPTRKYGPVWFTIVNGGPSNTEGFRQAQDQFLQTLSQRWGQPQRTVWSPPRPRQQLGDPARYQIVNRP